MSIEAGVVVGFDGKPMFWHLPPDRTGGSLPDHRDLWEVIWENRQRVFGFAHSHPGSGMTFPSWEDITTFAGIEAALGKRLCWWITSSNHVILVLWGGPGKYDYRVYSDPAGEAHYEWVEELRRHSSY